MVVVFGSVNVDLVARVAHLPREGETCTARSLVTSAGGKGANQALAASRAGAAVRLYGCVGRDGHGDVALGSLRADGVNVSGVAAVDGTTGLALIHVDDAGRNTITVVPGANALARADAVPDAVMGAGTTLLMQLEVPWAEVAALAVRARRCGARVALNAAPAAALPDELLACLDVLVVNESEASVLAGGTSLDVDKWCMARSTRGVIVVVTRGAAGVSWGAHGSLRHRAAPQIDVVDTIGAGDAFAGALVAALDRGAAFDRALDEALAGGALACTGAGAQPALPGRDAIKALADVLGQQ